MAVILDRFSRKVVGWALGKTLATRLPLEALHHAITTRQPPPGVVHHSDRGIQYAAGAYVQLLRQHQMLPSMSRPANPYDNASCESFMKTLKREEIYANAYRDLEHIHRNMAAFMTISTITASDSTRRWAIVHRRSSSTRWHQGTCLGRPGAFVVGHSCPRK